MFVDINDDGKIIITPSYTNAKGDQIDTKVYTLDKLDQLGRDLKKKIKNILEILKLQKLMTIL